MKKYPIKHISLRVPWHDSGWNGCVCEDPKNNLACLRIKNITLSKDEHTEQNIKGIEFSELNHKEVPPCLGERGNFMSQNDYITRKEHPYVKRKNPKYAHFLPTEFIYKKYSAAGVPYRWMLKSNMNELGRLYGLKVNHDKEPDLGFNTSWVQSKYNQEQLLDCFFEHIEEDKSLCIFYAKEVPFIEDSKRVIIGIGRVKNVGGLVEYKYSKDDKMKSVLWERNIEHSIRPDFTDGFLMPYKEVMQFGDENINFPIKEMVAFAPDDQFEEYSYATEHLSNDTVIESLINCMKALCIIQGNIKVDYSNQIRWINATLEAVWRYRGAYPGLGSVLTSFGVELGNFIAKSLEDKIDDENPWYYIDDLFENPSKYLDKNLVKVITNTLKETWKLMKQERNQYLKLLSRFDINIDQASMLLDSSARKKEGIDCLDLEILENPYELFELTRDTQFPIGIGIIDRGVFPIEAINNKFPLEEPSRIDGGNDKRRIRALIIHILDNASNEGHTLLPIYEVRRRLEKLPLDPPCIVSEDILNVVESYFKDKINIIELRDKNKAYQLNSLYKMENFIKTTVEKRMKSKKHEVNSDWEEIMNDAFGIVEDIKDYEDRTIEILARKEKLNALDVMSKGKISALVGEAGTGKTSIIKFLLSSDEIKNGETLLLAPTGKARVRLEEINKDLNLTAHTVAQFLSKSKRFNWKTLKYRMIGRTDEKSYGTVIIDEASMLTLDMIAALFECIKKSKRIILVGDTRQLPPIGSGRPFVDIVNYFRSYKEKNNKELLCELKVLNRQRNSSNEERLDTLLSKWFAGGEIHPSQDEIFDKIQGKRKNDHLTFVPWENEDDYYKKLEEVLVEELELENIEDINGFNRSLGAIDYKESTYFNLGAANKIEDWQILSPIKNPLFGCNTINHWIHKTFRERTVENSSKVYNRKLPKPLGIDQIVYGDKIINIANNARNCYPKDGNTEYLANGEIGIVVDGFNKKTLNYTNVEFSTQKGYKYGFSKGDFGEERDDTPLELAYGITVHKSQGSQFNKVILVIPKNCRLLSREMLYTALTRQKEKVIILYQGSIHDLKEYSLDRCSETARRLTNLFMNPRPYYDKDRHSFLDKNLVHRNSKGDIFRSKSELIISERLIAKEISYDYEKALDLSGRTRYPDFTIEDDYGAIYYWEHCGLMNDYKYKKRWKDKLKLYKDNKIYDINDGGNLIITYEDGTNGIDICEIDKIISKLE